MRLVYCLFLMCVFTMPAVALEEQPIYETDTVEGYSAEFIASQMENFSKTPDGGTSWDLFSQTKEEPYKFTDKEGVEWEGLKPQFSEELKALDGRSITMQGYMFPLDETEQQSQFLFGPFPLSCPYHYHAPNNLTIEVNAAKPVNFSYEPITISGKLELVPEDYEYNTFYKLKDVQIVKD